jgi:hypothetical protein
MKLSRFFIVLVALVLSPAAALSEEKSAHQTIGSSACEKCHKPQNEWWPKNDHYQTAEPFFEQKGKNTKIARLYGINPADMAKGNAGCMRCHGTVVSGSEKDEVTDGVGCEACHGPAKDYLKPHQEGERSLGDARPGRIKGLEFGMVNLRDMKVRVKACGRCHNISESKLISAGHPSADNFPDYFMEGMAKTRHWTRPLETTASLEKVFHEMISPKEATPAVKTAAPPMSEAPETILPKPADTPAVIVPTPSASVDVEPSTSPSPPSLPLPTPPEPKITPIPVRPPLPPRPRPTPPIAILETDLEEAAPLPPLPEVNPSTSVEEILMIVKEQLELLHRAVHKEP